MSVFDFLSGLFMEAVFLVEDFVSDHPILSILIFLVLFCGGCDLAVKVHIISSTTKLMPY